MKRFQEAKSVPSSVVVSCYRSLLGMKLEIPKIIFHVMFHVMKNASFVDKYEFQEKHI